VIDCQSGVLYISAISWLAIIAKYGTVFQRSERTS